MTDAVRIGTDEQFTIVRRALEEAGYTEAEVCRRTGISSLVDFEPIADQLDTPPTDSFSTFSRLFLEGRYAGLAEAEEHIGTSSLQALADLGLLETKPDDSSLLYSPVALYPTAGVYIASDRWNSPDRGPFPVASDVVYPAIVSNTQRFLQLLPRSPCEKLLDLCCGTGVAALYGAASFAGESYAADIAGRSVNFAEFNRRLNSLSNVVIRKGDLYDPVREHTFDRIIAHPPYVPTLHPSWIYYDGGEDGEAVTRRIVRELPQVLRPDGMLYLLATGTDRRSGRYEERVREWLGDYSSEFDVALIVIRTQDPADFAVQTALKGKTPEQDIDAYRQLFSKLEVEQMVYGALLLRRKVDSRNPFTVRRQKGPATGPDDLLNLLHWEAIAAGPDATDQILHSCVRANPDASLHITYKLTDEGWDATVHTLRSQHPFSMEAHTDTWVPYLMAVCDGSRTVAEHFDELKQESVLPEQAVASEFAQAVAILVSGGLLILEKG